MQFFVILHLLEYTEGTLLVVVVFFFFLVVVVSQNGLNKINL